ncbi:hypothetical protein [Maridesulfovibrio sp.]|uniref:hypothetical protein n=1 Tax=Maridesulfovibrio sp. TaxID=2795000 RepID=UPI0029F541BE|nr:hypothetical protein [Maridesulfovibrio sp.]
MEKQYVVVINGEVAYGPSEVDGKPSDEMKRLEKQTGGKIYPAYIHKPPLNVRMQVYGNSVPTIGVDRVDYHYPVVDRSDSAIRKNLCDEVKAEAEKRALGIAPYWKQINAITDPDPELTARIKAVRDASDQLEANIKVMDRDGLAAVNVAGWSGWPEVGLPV